MENFLANLFKGSNQSESSSPKDNKTANNSQQDSSKGNPFDLHAIQKQIETAVKDPQKIINEGINLASNVLQSLQPKDSTSKQPNPSNQKQATQQKQQPTKMPEANNPNQLNGWGSAGWRSEAIKNRQEFDLKNSAQSLKGIVRNNSEASQGSSRRVTFADEKSQGIATSARSGLKEVNKQYLRPETSKKLQMTPSIQENKTSQQSSKQSTGLVDKFKKSGIGQVAMGAYYATTDEAKEMMKGKDSSNLKNIQSPNLQRPAPKKDDLKPNTSQSKPSIARGAYLVFKDEMSDIIRDFKKSGQSNSGSTPSATNQIKRNPVNKGSSR